MIYRNTCLFGVLYTHRKSSHTQARKISIFCTLWSNMKSFQKLHSSFFPPLIKAVYLICFISFGFAIVLWVSENSNIGLTLNTWEMDAWKIYTCLPLLHQQKVRNATRAEGSLYWPSLLQCLLHVTLRKTHWNVSMIVLAVRHRSFQYT